MKTNISIKLSYRSFSNKHLVEVVWNFNSKNKMFLLNFTQSAILYSIFGVFLYFVQMCFHISFNIWEDYNLTCAYHVFKLDPSLSICHNIWWEVSNGSSNWYNMVTPWSSLQLPHTPSLNKILVDLYLMFKSDHLFILR